jgi:hypothetical protein
VGNIVEERGGRETVTQQYTKECEEREYTVETRRCLLGATTRLDAAACLLTEESD